MTYNRIIFKTDLTLENTALFPEPLKQANKLRKRKNNFLKWKYLLYHLVSEPTDINSAIFCQGYKICKLTF